MPLSNIDYEMDPMEAGEDSVEPAEGLSPGQPQTEAVERDDLPAPETGAEKPALNLPVAWNDATPERGPAEERPAQAPTEDGPENAEDTATVAVIRNFRSRLDSTQGSIRGRARDAEEWTALLDHAIALLESVSRHPALGNYGGNKRKLEEIEQRLGYGAYPQ